MSDQGLALLAAQLGRVADAIAGLRARGEYTARAEGRWVGDREWEGPAEPAPLDYVPVSVGVPIEKARARQAALLAAGDDLADECEGFYSCPRAGCNACKKQPEQCTVNVWRRLRKATT